jgi:NDP-sugar pyrophosphorylase family protein
MKLIRFGITDIVVNTHHFSEKIEEYFSAQKFNANINLIYEEKILGTGGGIKNARRYLDGAGDFLVHNVDVDSDVNLLDMYRFHKKNNALATLAVKKRTTARPLIIDSNNNLVGRKINDEDVICRNTSYEIDKTAFSGIQILSSGIFSYFPDYDNFDIITVYLGLAARLKKIVVYDIKNHYWKDLGKQKPFN